MTESDEIEEILYEAFDLGIRDLVIDGARELLKKNKKIRKSLAYQQSFNKYKTQLDTQIGSEGIMGKITPSEK